MEPKRSCCSRETCCGMRVVTAAFIFAIINAVIITAGTLCSTSLFIQMLITRLDPERWREQETNSAFLFFMFVTSISFVGTVIPEVFAVLLCVGISKRKPRCVMAYLVYGIIIEIVAVIATILFIWMQWGAWELVYYGGIPLGMLCVIYALLLVLVKQAYTVLSESQIQGHRKLINNQFDF